MAMNNEEIIARLDEATNDLKKAYSLLDEYKTENDKLISSLQQCQKALYEIAKINLQNSTYKFDNQPKAVQEQMINNYIFQFLQVSDYKPKHMKGIQK